MQEYTEITGMVLKAEPIGEYDRRVVILTKEKGKISAFAKGSRRQGSRLLAATNPFSFGIFRIYVGKSSYNILEAEISNYFEGLRNDFEGACYGMYFLEVIDYYTRENNDDKEMLKLIYQSLRALMHDRFPDDMVRYIFEIKAMVLSGEFPGIPETKEFETSTIYAVNYIVTSSVEKLYTFSVTDTVLTQLKDIADEYRKRYVDRTFKSLEILDDMGIGSGLR